MCKEVGLRRGTQYAATVWLRYHAMPRDLSALIAPDPNVFRYLMVQTAKEFIAEVACVEITEVETLALGVLLIRCYHASTSERSGESPKLEAWLTIEKALGFSVFFPPRLRDQYPSNPLFFKAVMKAMLQFNHLTKPAECQKSLIDLLCNLNPDFGVHTNGDPPTAMVGASGITLYAPDGFTVTTEVPLNGVVDCLFGGGKSVSLRHGTDEESKLQLIRFGKPEAAGHFFATCELYRALAAQHFHPPGTVAVEEGVTPDTFYELLSSRPETLEDPDPDDVIELAAAAKKETEKDIVNPALLAPNDGEVIWEIPLREVEFEDEDVLGDGQFGQVLHGVWLGADGGESNKCAIKQLKEEPGETPAQTKARCDEFLEEAHLMKSFDHPGIMMLYGVTLRAGLPMIVMELMPLGELRAFVRTKQGILRKTTLAIEYVAQVAAGIQYLHARNVIHRDLAARNILAKDPKTVKVADFGLSKNHDGEYISKGGKLPLKWMAPESALKERHSSKSDVWMFGVCAWEILSYGVKPFLRVKNNEYLKELKGGTRLEKPKGCPKAVYDVLLSCWAWQPRERPTFNIIIEQIQVVLDKFARCSCLPPDILLCGSKMV
jgi:hypothetical protein